MKTNDIKQAILSKTHYGLGIYSHILRQYYPNEIALKLVKRDCGISRNPFNYNKETLHIWIEKTDPNDVTSKEYAHHEDKENAIPAGDPFTFAEQHYKQTGAELLQTLNKELHLHIGEQWSFYKNNNTTYKTTVPPVPKVPNPPNPANPKNPINQGSDFSFFKAPITNTKPHKTVTLQQIYNAIKGDYYKSNTEKLRTILASPLSFGEGPGERLARQFKATNFDYCTFSGTFTTRSDKALIKHSGLLCLDFDHLQNLDSLRSQLLQDEYFDTQLLFVSPSGDGLKWIISIPALSPFRGQGGITHSNYFTAVANYIQKTYGITVDKSGRDLSRACFLPHDPQAYINPQIINCKS